jgi:hypothetical protein
MQGISKRIGLFAATLCGALAVASAASADVSDFLGNWTNPDASTTGVTRMQVSPAGPNRVRIRVFGQCHPVDCDWGEVVAHSYFDDPGSSHVRSVMATFDQGFAKRVIVLRERAGDRLSFEILTDFTDGSGRRDYDMTGRLRPAPSGGWGGGWGGGPGGGWGGGPGGPGGGWGGGPGGPGGPRGGSGGPGGGGLAEDCVNFNPATTHAAFAGGAWKLVDGSHWIADFGSNAVAAHQAEDIVHHYHFSQQCFVGRPNPSMTYWKNTAGGIPASGMPGDDCIAFDPATTHVAHVGGAWKIVDGSHWIADFGSDAAEANQAMSIINTYNLNRQCFVARPNPPMTYWLRQ